MTMKKTMLTAAVLLAVPGLAAAGAKHPHPRDLVSVSIGKHVEKIWPYTGTDYSASPSDPINLIFEGEADPRLIRQTLLDLDGDRTGPFESFTCTWRDAIGRPQTSYSRAARWEGSAIQLECGDYAAVRVHLRLFRHGRYTLGGAHLEVQIPGTSEHEVLSWEIPEAFVMADLARSLHLVESPAQTGPITATPSFRAIRSQVFNLLPVELRMALGLPTENQSSDVPLVNDGRATVLALGGLFEPAVSDVIVEFDHPFGQLIPKPFCATSPRDGLYVSGMIHMVHRVRTDADGRYVSRFQASGTLTVIPFDLATQQPTSAAPYLATVSEVYRSRLTDDRQTAYMAALQTLLSDPAQSLYEMLWAGRKQRYVRRECCGY